MCTYGIVKVELYTVIKEIILNYTITLTSSYILANTQRQGNPKTSVVHRGAPIYLHMQHLTPRQP